LREWTGNGEEVRSMSREDWNVLCPSKWWCVYGFRWHPSKQDRKAVGKHIYDVVMPLVVAEAKRKGDVAMNEKVFDDATTLVGSKKKVSLLSLWNLSCAEIMTD
jgi:hypothetical protein